MENSLWRDRTTRRLDTLSSLRFIAAAVIVVHHSRGVLWLTQDSLKNIPLDQAVSFFFVLSGFVLTYVHPKTDRIIPFYMARFARVWPLHALTFLALVAGFWPHSFNLLIIPSALIPATLNILLIHGWIPIQEIFFSYNSVSWAVSTEVFFYLVFPFLMRNFENTWEYKLCGSFLLAALLIAFCNWIRLPWAGAVALDKISSTGILYINPLARLFEFVLGMSAAWLWKAHGKELELSRVAASWLETGMVCAALLSVYYSLPLVTALSGFVGPAGREYLCHAASAVPFAALISVMALQKGALSVLLRLRPLVALGEASFAIFMFHQIILRCYQTRTDLFSSLPTPLLYGLFWIILILLSLAATHVVERPAQRLIMRFVKGP